MHISPKYLMASIGLAASLLAQSPSAQAQMRLWGTYYGGPEDDWPHAIATDSRGNVYTVGRTDSSTEIVTPNGFDTTFDASIQGYLAKFDSNGQLQWATYFGDGASAVAIDVKVDSQNNVYVLGSVICPSTNLASPGHDTTCQGVGDMFLMRFDANGKKVWGTYFGGNGEEAGVALSVGKFNDLYVVGRTDSPQGIAIPTSVDKTLNGEKDAFVAKYNSLGLLQWSRYFGANGDETGKDISCRAHSLGGVDICYIAGMTNSSTGIATVGAHDSTINTAGSIQDAFLARLNSVNGATEWSTYYGGNKGAIAESLVVDASFNVYLGGSTKSDSGIATAGTHDSTWNGVNDIFLAKFDVNGTRKAATYFGGNNPDAFLRNDGLEELAIDSSDNVYLLGWTEGTSGIATPNAFDTTLSALDAVIAKFSPSLIRDWATYYGGNFADGDQSGGISVGRDGHVYVTGNTNSTGDLLATPGSHKPVKEGIFVGDILVVEQDAFIAEFAQ